MEKILFLYFLFSLIYCEQYIKFQKDKLYNEKCALFISKEDNLTLILNKESNCLDNCIAYNSNYLEDVIYGFCYNSYDFFKLSGEKCKGDLDCYSKNCKDNICIGKLENEKCNKNAECDVGLYCNNKKCEKLKNEGENCFRLDEDDTYFLDNMDDNCYAGLVCNNDKCVKLGSLPYKGSDYIDNEFSCKSGYEGDNGCVDYLQEQILEDSSKNQCLVKYIYGNETNYDIKNCKKNIFGNKVTARQIKFNNFQNYVNEYNKLLNEKGKEKIHILNKLDLGNKSLMYKYLDSIKGYLFKDIDNDYKIVYYNNYFYFNYK
jgi:hypothetical protein